MNGLTSALALPALLVVVLVASARVPSRSVRSPLFGALGETASAALYFPSITAVRGAGDGSGLWGIGTFCLAGLRYPATYRRTYHCDGAGSTEETGRARGTSARTARVLAPT